MSYQQQTPGPKDAPEKLFTINGRLYKAFTQEFQITATTANAMNPKAFGYRPGTIIRRVLVQNASTVEFALGLCLVNENGSNFPGGPPVPLPLVRGSGNGSFNTGDLGPLDLVDDGQANLGLALYAGDSSAGLNVNVMVVGLLPV